MLLFYTGPAQRGAKQNVREQRNIQVVWIMASLMGVSTALRF